MFFFAHKMQGRIVSFFITQTNLKIFVKEIISHSVLSFKGRNFHIGISVAMKHLCGDMSVFKFVVLSYKFGEWFYFFS